MTETRLITSLRRATELLEQSYVRIDSDFKATYDQIFLKW